MTSAGIGGMNSLMNYVAPSSTGSSYVSDSTSSFKDSLKNATSQNETAANPKETQVKQTDSSKDHEVKESPQKVERSKEKKVDDTQMAETSMENEVDAGAMQEQLEAAGNQLLEDVAKELGVDLQDVLDAMETLGLTAVDLLDPSNMTSLVLEMEEEPDVMSLVTDENLYAGYSNLMDDVQTMVDGLAEKLGVDEDAIKDMVETYQEDGMIEKIGLPNPDAVVDASEETKSEVVTNQSVATIETPVEKPQDVETTDDSKVEWNPVKKDIVVEDTRAEEKQEDAGEQSLAEQTSASTRETSGEESLTHTNNAVFFENLESKLQALMNETVETEGYTENVSASEVIDQITEYMKASISQDMTSMEMQLHPASLGNVHVQITSREGMITAQFTAQDELVKGAIEGQIVQLKESFEEQGVKVDAIEVTVESHGFERNLEQGNDNRNNQNQANPGKKGVRRINISDLNALEDEDALSDEEKIAAEMMIENGNTVDYTV